ncbi:hypothetical protein [Ramlibacter sp.]|uniref:hypothetical protein n=1 Tax=Ramlibacter sp. TaxID=1917967 RepID=UPI003D0BFEE8
MSEADLVADLKASLFDAANAFTEANDAAFKRFLQQALPDMQVKKPLTRLGQLALVAGTPRYAPAADFAALKIDLWRDPARLPKPWEPTYPGPLPFTAAAWDGDAWWIQFEPAPTAAQIGVLGSTFSYWYFATHVISATAADTTVNPQDRGLLLVRAQAEAMLAMANRNAGKPVSMRDGLSGTPRNSTPAALFQLLMDVFREAR